MVGPERSGLWMRAVYARENHDVLAGPWIKKEAEKGQEERVSIASTRDARNVPYHLHCYALFSSRAMRGSVARARAPNAFARSL